MLCCYTILLYILGSRQLLLLNNNNLHWILQTPVAEMLSGIWSCPGYPLGEVVIYDHQRLSFTIN